MFAERFDDTLKRLRRQGLFRDPAPVDRQEGPYVYCGGRRLLNFASNDYLGLGAGERLRVRIARHFERYGPTAASSRLTAANHALIREAEAAFAEYFGYERALFFNSGFSANLGVLSALFQAGDTVFFDKRAHASVLAGLTLGRAVMKGYNHNDLGHLAKRLSRCGGPAAVVTESLFSMDGDSLDARALQALKSVHGFYCVVDEAHAFGVLGPGGRGTARAAADVAVGTLGKAFGLFGAVVLASDGVVSYLLNTAAPLIYSTALPPAQAAAALDALDLIAQSGGRRRYLADLSRWMKARLLAEGFSVDGDAHILRITLGAERAAMAAAGRLFEKGFFLLAARYPTVPMNQAMLRISLTAVHTRQDAGRLIAALKEAVSPSGRCFDRQAENRRAPQRTG